jgi:uncharacterized membrane protein required for colicin V production
METKARVAVMTGGAAVLMAFAVAYTYLNHNGVLRAGWAEDTQAAYVNDYTVAISIVLTVLFCGCWLIASRGLSFRTKLLGAALCVLIGVVFFGVFVLYNLWMCSGRLDRGVGESL